jgi:hypothetical protein
MCGKAEPFRLRCYVLGLRPIWPGRSPPRRMHGAENRRLSAHRAAKPLKKWAVESVLRYVTVIAVLSLCSAVGRLSQAKAVLHVCGNMVHVPTYARTVLIRLPLQIKGLPSLPKITSDWDCQNSRRESLGGSLCSRTESPDTVNAELVPSTETEAETVLRNVVTTITTPNCDIRSATVGLRQISSSNTNYLPVRAREMPGITLRVACWIVWRRTGAP